MTEGGLPRLSKRDWDALGSLMLPIQLGGKRKLGPKCAERLLAHGYVEPCEERIFGSGHSPLDRIPVVIKGYRMTLAGNLAYCLWADENCTDTEVMG